MTRIKRKGSAHDHKKTINLFYSYSHKDKVITQKLRSPFETVKGENVIDTWHDRKISAGREWEQAIDKNLEAADIILLLISADFRHPIIFGILKYNTPCNGIRNKQLLLFRCHCVRVIPAMRIL